MFMPTQSKYKSVEVKFLTRSLILALSICYQARLKCRDDYEKGIAQEFSPPLELAGRVKQFRAEIERYHKYCMYTIILVWHFGNVGLNPSTVCTKKLYASS